MKLYQNLFVVGLVTLTVLLFDSQMAAGFTMEGVTKTPDGKCKRESDGLILGVKEAKTFPGCIEFYCRLFEDKVYMQKSVCPTLDDKPGCKKTEGAADKPFPECCAVNTCA